MAGASFSDDERRVLALIAVLVTLGAGARWLERPREVLPDVPALDVAALEEASRAQQDGRATGGGSTSGGAGGRAVTPIDPNTASARDLERLPGVGPAVAARIVEARGQAPFRTTGDLTRVRGIGPATIAKWDGLLTLPAGPATPTDGGGGPGGSTSAGGSPGGDDAAGGGRHPASGGTRAGGTLASGPARGGDPVSRRDGAGGHDPGPPLEAASGEPTPPLSLNSASEQELQRIRGIGPALARRIIARRDSLRYFERWEQVDSIAGIGPTLLASLKAQAVLR